MGDNPRDSKASSMPSAAELPLADAAGEGVRCTVRIGDGPEVTLDQLQAAVGDLAAAGPSEAELAMAREMERDRRGAGHIDGEARAAIEQIAERALLLMEQRDAVNQTIRDLFAFARQIGFAPTPLRAAIKALREDKAVRIEREMVIEAYRGALGIEGPEMVVEIARPALPIPPSAKKITAKEKTFRDSMALIAASRIADAM